MLVRHTLLLEFPPLMTEEQRLSFFYWNVLAVSLGECYQ
jgi:hypothetical protein